MLFVTCDKNEFLLTHKKLKVLGFKSIQTNLRFGQKRSFLIFLLISYFRYTRRVNFWRLLTITDFI